VAALFWGFPHQLRHHSKNDASRRKALRENMQLLSLQGICEATQKGVIRELKYP
jgi:hypothetical protein